MKNPVLHHPRHPGTRRSLLIGLLLLGLGSRAEATSLPTERRAALDGFVRPFVELAMFDGSLLIERGGEVLYETSFGLANYEHRVPHRPTTRFRIASVSKLVTDVAVARSIQSGTLRLDTPLSRYLPSFPSADAITIEHLVSHRAGIPHTNRMEWGDGKTSLTVEEIVERLAAVPLDFEPGSKSSYSNGGYAVLARVLEIVGGASFGEVLRATVLDPLGMDDTDHIPDVRAVIPGIATGYEPGPYPGERRHSRFYAVEARPGGGSLYSTPRDLLRLARAVFREGFVTPELRRQVLGEGEGPFLAQGRSPGFVAKLYVEPETDLIVISLANSYAVPSDWGRALADLALGRPFEEPWPRIEPRFGPLPADDPRYGVYRSSRGFEVVLARTDRGAIVIDDRHGDSITALVPLADGTLLLPIYYQRCEPDEAIEVLSCRMLSGEARYGSVLTRQKPDSGTDQPQE